MAHIKSIFSTGKDIYRPIEKVVTFGNSSEEHLKHEISEYVVTDKLKDSFEKLLDSLYSGMDSGTTEVGIWVSGFYGSGKSSFAKYLGLALDKDCIVDGNSFTERLSNRINSAPVNQLFKTIIKNHDPAIVLLDCATEQIKGGNLPPVLELMIAKVYKMAGFSTDSQMANLEVMLKQDGKFDEFVSIVNDRFKLDWHEIKNKTQLKAKGIASQLASEMYPEIWPDSKAFKNTRVDDMSNDKEKVERLLETVRTITGKENVIFVVDEVGQYISAKDGLILSMQGTMENLKDIGQGKAWLLATAQQTLTEDNAKARLNSEKLYKLNARFPVKVDIEASDIKEICTKRLLGKSTDGTNQLKALYKANGEKLKHYTKLENSERSIYKDQIDEKLFIDLYPFLPQHFSIILSLLGRLARITGGVGLRSAIKVIQDILTDKLESESTPIAEHSLGKLATAYHIYDVLKADIRKSYSHVVSAIDKVIEIYGGEQSEHAKVAKAIGVLQLLDDLFLSPNNVASLMHPNVDSDSISENTKKIIEEIKATRGCTLTEIDGQLRFMTEAITNIEKEKESIVVQPSHTRKVFESIIKDIFLPVPRARLANTKTVQTGINLNIEGRVLKLLENTEAIQTEVAFTTESDYKKLVDDFSISSTENANKTRIYLVGKLDNSIENDITEIVKCEEIYSTRNRYDDKEINDYLKSQDQAATDLKDKIRRILVQAFEKGEFIFKGASKPTRALGSSLRDAFNTQLKKAAEVIYDKYTEAPISVGGADTERLLKFDDLKQVPSALNHFDLIKSDGSIEMNHAALKSIREFIDHEGQVEGRKLLEHFDAPRFGWSKDTSRYLVAILFIASDIKLRISGEDVKVRGPKSTDALKNINGFNKIGISLYDSGDRPSMAMLSKSVQRLAELTDETVAPLPQKIADVVRKHFPEFQTKYSSVQTELELLNLPGIERAKNVKEGIAEVLKGEASDAAFRLGKDESDLFTDLKWIKGVYEAFEKNARSVFQKAETLQKDINQLPDSGIPKELKDSCAEHFSRIDEILKSEDFVDEIPNLKEATAEIENLIADYGQRLQDAENQNIKEKANNITSGANWKKLNSDQKSEIGQQIDNLQLSNKQGIKGIQETLNTAYSVQNTFRAVEEQIAEYVKAKQEKTPQGKKTTAAELSDLPKQITKVEELDEIIKKLEELKSLVNDETIIELNW